MEFDLCVITRRSKGRGHLEVARAALEGGARLVQLRDKGMGTRALFEVAQEIRRLASGYGATFIVNDRVEIALAVGAEGVHLGDEDLPVSAARRLMGPQAIMGVSVDGLEKARAAEAEGASYVSVGSIYPTSSKPDAGEAIGLELLGQIKREVGLPVLAIGGISRHNVSEVIRSGADGVAVISAVADAEDMEAAVVELREAILAARQGRGTVGADS